MPTSLVLAIFFVYSAINLIPAHAEDNHSKSTCNAEATEMDTMRQSLSPWLLEVSEKIKKQPRFGKMTEQLLDSKLAQAMYFVKFSESGEKQVFSNSKAKVDEDFEKLFLSSFTPAPDIACGKTILITIDLTQSPPTVSNTWFTRKVNDRITTSEH